MPVVTVWCLPEDFTELQLNELHRQIVQGAVSVPEVGIKDETGMTVRFPKDMMKYGLGTDIVIEILSGDFDRRDIGPNVRTEFAFAMVEAVKKSCPTAAVECFTLPYKRSDGFYHSPANEQMPVRHKQRGEGRPGMGLG